jgi:hypothetical protein
MYVNLCLGNGEPGVGCVRCSLCSEVCIKLQRFRIAVSAQLSHPRCHRDKVSENLRVQYTGPLAAPSHGGNQCSVQPEDRRVAIGSGTCVYTVQRLRFGILIQFCVCVRCETPHFISQSLWHRAKLPHPPPRSRSSSSHTDFGPEPKLNSVQCSSLHTPDAVKSTVPDHLHSTLAPSLCSSTIRVALLGSFRGATDELIMIGRLKEDANAG